MISSVWGFSRVDRVVREREERDIVVQGRRGGEVLRSGGDVGRGCM